METQDPHKKVTDWRTTKANMYQQHVDAPLPRGAPSHTPRRGKGVTASQQTSQHQRLFADTQPQVTPTDPLTGSKTPHQADVQNTAFTDMAQDAAFANLNLGGTHGNQHSFDRARTGIASNMYPDTVGTGATPRIPIAQGGRIDTITPIARPPTPATQALNGTEEIYNRYITTMNQDTSPDSLIPVVYQLRLEKIARSCRNLETEVIAMGKYARGLHRPNQNTNGAY